MSRPYHCLNCGRELGYDFASAMWVHRDWLEDGGHWWCDASKTQRVEPPYEQIRVDRERGAAEREEGHRRAVDGDPDLRLIRDVIEGQDDG